MISRFRICSITLFCDITNSCPFNYYSTLTVRADLFLKYAILSHAFHTVKFELDNGRHFHAPITVNFYSILFYPITLESRRGTTDEFATIPFHLVLFSAALVELAKSIPVHSLVLSSHLFFCLPLFLFPFTVPCRIVFA